MTSNIQREQLHSQIWKMAGEVRGAVDGWDFKQFVLGMLFYRFLSEHFAAYVETGAQTGFRYADLLDEGVPDESRVALIEQKGYFIAPSQLFENVARDAAKDKDLNIRLREIFDAIEGSAVGYKSEPDLKGLFADFDTTSTRLGTTVDEKNRRLCAVMQGVATLDFGAFEDSQIDLFGDAYEFLISNYAANAGKSGGEFFTPSQVSRLIAKLALHGQTQVNKIYDPACGSGSLLLQARRLFEVDRIREGFYGQEVNLTTYNLARMNMFLHGINYNDFDIQLGDTLLDPKHTEEKPFDAIVSNPPYSISWAGSENPTLINDERFAPAGVLAPRSKADFAFILHAVNHLSARGRAAVVCFPGIFYRGRAERKIRKYLVDSNYIECIISLPTNLFYGTSIAVNILTLSKHKADARIRFIDASGEDFFRKETNNNVLTDEHIAHIVELFASGEDVPHVARWVDLKEVEEQDYNLSVSSYIEAEDTREEIDITNLNSRIQQTVARINTLRSDIDAIISELEA
ncbi:type I restriction-modification system subunit M [uncultured Porphyromonas sp.]|uniref:type I restriction-modification system subunit M n=1 Tax=uncultured Porphyromonas sp. TaxID=159274 RepID=UPI002626C920|nr:type I restriction-modification system subunit M [uncultured Porphyromonas sp.]